MTYDARQIANWFVRRASRDSRGLSIMSLLKLSYISHGWHLEMRKTPLFTNKIEAWQYGPVIPDVYGAFRGQGVTISNVVPIAEQQMDPSDENLLEQIYNIYGSMSPFQLSELTHEANGPWDQATKRFGWFAPITDDLIRPHYEMKRAAAQQMAKNA